MANNLLSSFSGRKPFDQIQVGDLVTVNLVDTGNNSQFVRSGARVTRVACGTFFVKLAGLSVPAPYEVGMQFPLSAEKIVDWG